MIDCILAHGLVRVSIMKISVGVVPRIFSRFSAATSATTANRTTVVVLSDARLPISVGIVGFNLLGTGGSFLLVNSPFPKPGRALVRLRPLYSGRLLSHALMYAANYGHRVHLRHPTSLRA